MKFMKLGCRPDAFHTDGNDVRFLTTELASDIIISVGDVKFYLHKFPLLSKCGRLQDLIVLAEEENDGEIRLPGMPGGAAAFEICANESVEKGNLIFKLDVFLSSSVLRSWKDSIVLLQTTKALLPWSEDLNLVGRCVDSIASKVCIDISMNGAWRTQAAPPDWWVEDLCDLDMELFERVIAAVKAKGPQRRRVSGFAKGVIQLADVEKNRSLVEAIIWLLPAETGSVSSSFLLRLLRAACVLGCEEEGRKEMIKKVARQLDGASVSDLLIPSPEGEKTLYDVDLVRSILEEFVMINGGTLSLPGRISTVGKLVDGYLTEISRDPNLPLCKFLDLAEMVPADARTVGDGLYRAIDMFLKEHPGLSKSEKKKLCGVMDSRKLSPEAREHAVQNERLPLRVVVRVLFFAAGGLSPEKTRGYYGSSVSAATTNTSEDWTASPPSRRGQRDRLLEGAKAAAAALTGR
ncbi:unnamed protein product [Spirodela intermedia]|uniref:NPH3 domain-containing protein n=1 Tax=Spirodela intermedia TaxID=51605 RepID=A0A7I8JBE8_SPIIN|nr:unnamed protein product [Spirodela intermedia]CAA6667404.1 unnamed protein product [Spirodela intermedia]